MAKRSHEAADYKCHKITHLTGQKNADKAKGLLTRLADQAQPIMAKYKWKVGVLAEFIPKSAGLLGLNYNRGAKIQIRLRTPEDVTTFFPWDHLLKTMLHELVHCKIGSMTPQRARRRRRRARAHLRTHLC